VFRFIDHQRGEIAAPQTHRLERRRGTPCGVEHLRVRPPRLGIPAGEYVPFPAPRRLGECLRQGP
jgi:hypothetical protein